MLRWRRACMQPSSPSWSVPKPDDWRQDVGGLLDTDLAPSDVPEQKRRVEDSAHVVVATAGAVLHRPWSSAPHW